jgi:hypothetical protein
MIMQPSFINRAQCRLVAGLSLLAFALPFATRGAEATNTLNPRPPLAMFKLFTERNIFNAKRSERGYIASPLAENPRPRPTDFFALVGVMSYEKGPFAFFEGSSSQFQKVLKPDDSIAGFKLGEIRSDAVKLVSPTNEIDLKVGMQMTRVDQGWKIAARAENLDKGGNLASWAAQPAAPKTDNDTQQDFPFPGGGNVADLIQAFRGNQPGGQFGPGGQNNGGNGRPAAIVAPPNGNNGNNGNNANSGNNGAAESPDVILQRLIQRRQQENP